MSELQEHLLATILRRYRIDPISGVITSVMYGKPLQGRTRNGRELKIGIRYNKLRYEFNRQRLAYILYTRSLPLTDAQILTINGDEDDMRYENLIHLRGDHLALYKRIKEAGIHWSVAENTYRMKIQIAKKVFVRRRSNYNEIDCYSTFLKRFIRNMIIALNVSDATNYYSPNIHITK